MSEAPDFWSDNAKAQGLLKEKAALETLVGEVPRLRGRTLYTIIGDLFAWAAALVAAVALGAAVRAGRGRGARS